MTLVSRRGNGNGKAGGKWIKTKIEVMSFFFVKKLRQVEVSIATELNITEATSTQIQVMIGMRKLVLKLRETIV